MAQQKRLVGKIKPPDIGVVTSTSAGLCPQLPEEPTGLVLTDDAQWTEIALPEVGEVGKLALPARDDVVLWGDGQWKDPATGIQWMNMNNEITFIGENISGDPGKGDMKVSTDFRFVFIHTPKIILATSNNDGMIDPVEMQGHIEASPSNVMLIMDRQIAGVYGQGLKYRFVSGSSSGGQVYLFGWNFTINDATDMYIDYWMQQDYITASPDVTIPPMNLLIPVYS